MRSEMDGAEREGGAPGGADRPRDLAAFFAIYRSAFTGFDRTRLARLFAPPVTIVEAEGSLHLPDAGAVEDGIERLLARYRSFGMAEARLETLAHRVLSQAFGEAHATWSLRREDGSRICRFHTSYVLRLVPSPRIVFVASHDERASWPA